MAQWARLLILLDSLTYYLWFWTAFFWVVFNYYTVFQERTYHFEAKPMTVFSWALQFLSWAMVIFATARYRMDQSMQSNEVFFLSLTNLWRTTQLFYITAPLTLYSIATGCGEFSRHRMLNVDITYWNAGDRGSISTTITKWWTLLLMFGAIAVNIIYWFDLLTFVDPISAYRECYWARCGAHLRIPVAGQQERTSAEATVKIVAQLAVVHCAVLSAALQHELLPQFVERLGVQFQFRASTAVGWPPAACGVPPPHPLQARAGRQPGSPAPHCGQVRL